VNSRLPELLAIMARLRAADGCPWDRQQTFASIAPYTVEEAYEVADAIERGDLGNLKDELGDLLFQVVFHAQIAREAGAFDFEAVAAAICDKLTRRHPHVFGDHGALSIAEQGVAWEDIKAAERAATDSSALQNVPNALPALVRAYKLSKRAARVGFDFENAGQCAQKVEDELAEVRAAARDSPGVYAASGAAAASGVAASSGVAAASGVAAGASGPSAQIFEEIGDLLFAAANLARKLDVDAEAALRAANAKFERRFRGMESLAAQRGQEFAQLDLAAQEDLWQAVKRGE
jgi:nucleoside triphosphate diphosphatase